MKEDHNNLFENPSINSLAASKFLVYKPKRLAPNSNHSIPIEKESMYTIKQTVTNISHILVKKEVEFFMHRSKLFSNYSNYHLLAVKANYSKEHLRYFYLSRLLIEREFIFWNSLTELLKKLQTKEFMANMHLDKGFGEFKDPSTWMRNLHCLHLASPVTLEQTLIVMTTHFNQFEYKGLAGFTSIVKEVPVKVLPSLTTLSKALLSASKRLVDIMTKKAPVSACLSDIALTIVNILAAIKKFGLKEGVSEITLNLQTAAISFLKVMGPMQDQSDLSQMTIQEITNIIQVLSLVPKGSQKDNLGKILIQALESFNLNTVPWEYIYGLLKGVVSGGAILSPKLGENIEKYFIDLNIQVMTLQEVHAVIFAYKNSNLSSEKLINLCHRQLIVSIELDDYSQVTLNKLIMALHCVEFFASSPNSSYLLNRALKKKLPALLTAVEEHYHIRNLKFNECLNLVSFLFRHFRIPEFLFSDLIKRIEFACTLQIVMKKQTTAIRYLEVGKSHLKNFIEEFMKTTKINYIYSLNSTPKTGITDNSRWTVTSLKLFRLLVLIIQQSDSLSINLYTLIMSANKEFFDDVVLKDESKKEILNPLIQQISSLFDQPGKSLPISYLNPLLETVVNYCDILDQSCIEVLLINFSKHLDNLIKKDPKNLELLKYIFYFSKALHQLEKKPLIDSKDLREIITPLKSQLREVFLTEMLNPILEICETTMTDLRVNASVKQSFNPNILSSSFANTAHLPETLLYLEIRLIPSIQSSFTRLFERTARLHSGASLWPALKALETLSLLSPTLLKYSLPSVLSLFSGYASSGEFVWERGQKEATDVLELFSKIGRGRKDEAEVRGERLPLSMLLSVSGLFERKEDERLLVKIIEVLGDDKSNYCEEVIEEINKGAIKVTDPEAVVTILSSLPPSIRPPRLPQLMLKDSKKHSSHRDYLKAVDNLRKASPEIALQAVVQGEKELQYPIQDILKELVKIKPKTLGQNIKTLSNIVSNHQEELSSEDKENFVSIVLRCFIEETENPSFDGLEKSCPLAADWLKELVHSQEYCCFFVTLKDDEGNPVEINFYPSFSYEIEDPKGQLSKDFEKYKMYPKLFPLEYYENRNQELHQKEDKIPEYQKLKFVSIFEEMRKLCLIEARTELQKEYARKLEFLRTVNQIYGVNSQIEEMSSKLREVEYSLKTPGSTETENADNAENAENTESTEIDPEISYCIQDLSLSLALLGKSFITAHAIYDDSIIFDVFIPSEKTGFIVLPEKESIFDIETKEFVPTWGQNHRNNLIIEKHKDKVEKIISVPWNCFEKRASSKEKSAILSSLLNKT